MSFPLTLGPVTFGLLEVPETIGPFGGRQVLVVHEFPGGVKDVDDIGAFPHRLKWSGIFSGANSFDRAAQLDRLRTTAQVVELNYGPQSFSGKIANFSFNPKHQFLIPYEIEFEPIADLSGVGTMPQGSISEEVDLGDETTAATDIQDGDNGLPLPASLDAPTTAMLASVQAGLLDGNGTVVGIQTADAQAITAAVAAVQATSVPLIANPNPAIASPALDMAAHAAAISLIVASPKAAARQFQAINPNLYSLAAQYFNDATRWQDIATASGLTDPQPIGEFTITVPAA